MLNASPAASKGSVGEIWAGWVESEKFIEYDLELIICESGFHWRRNVGEVLVLPDGPVQCPPVLFGEEGLGQWRREIGRVFVGVKLAGVRVRWQGGAWGTIRGRVVVATEAAYTVGKAGN